jgi:alpha-galactosidase
VWSGEKAPGERRFWAWLLWSDKYLYARFVAPHAEPLVVNSKPDLTKKTMGLWERDVCEIFIAPDKTTPNKYFEFEIAPTGEWIDLGIEVTPKERLTDWKYSSKMQSAASDIKGETYLAIKIPFSSLGRTPKAGDVWLGNVFRCIGKDPTRGYLAWRPTKTPNPNFHVPSAFGEFHFIN